MASDSRQRARRRQALQAHGATHPRPQAVTDPLFRGSAFFDPNDLVQVSTRCYAASRRKAAPWWMR